MLTATETQSPAGKPVVTDAKATGPKASFPVLKGDARFFAPFTFGRLGTCLHAIPDHMVAVGVIVAGRPAGLALGTAERGQGRCELLSIAVTLAMRGQGLGTRLLEAWQAEARSRGATDFHASFNESLPTRAAFEALMAGAGWSAPAESGVVVVGRVGKMADQVGTWRAIAGRLSETQSYSFEPVDLGPADVEAVERYLADPDAADMWGPIRQAAQLAHDFSVLVRRDGRLVGWLLATESQRTLLDPDAPCADKPAIRYLEAFLDPAYWHSGIMIAAYYHCYSKQAERLGRDSVAIYYTSRETRPRMVALTRRRFAPLAERVETLFSVTCCTSQQQRTNRQEEMP